MNNPKTFTPKTIEALNLKEIAGGYGTSLPPEFIGIK